jgi:drug/metabolite transporter (DMT)-like permease
MFEKTGSGGVTPLAWFAVIVALIGITVGTRYQKLFGGSIDWRPALLIQYGTADILFSIGALAFETRVVHWTPQFLLAVGYLAIVLSLGAVWLYYYLIRRAAATRVVSLFYLTPPITALMAWALFDERLAPLALLGNGGLLPRSVSLRGGGNAYAPGRQFTRNTPTTRMKTRSYRHPPPPFT